MRATESSGPICSQVFKRQLFIGEIVIQKAIVDQRNLSWTLIICFLEIRWTQNARKFPTFVRGGNKAESASGMRTRVKELVKNKSSVRVKLNLSVLATSFARLRSLTHVVSGFTFLDKVHYGRFLHCSRLVKHINCLLYINCLIVKLGSLRWCVTNCFVGFRLVLVHF